MFRLVFVSAVYRSEFKILKLFSKIADSRWRIIEFLYKLAEIVLRLIFKVIDCESEVQIPKLIFYGGRFEIVDHRIFMLRFDY